MQINHLSTEYVPYQVDVKKQGQVYDPTGDAVSFAFTMVGSGVDPTNWASGIWESYNGIFSALGLVGPNGGTVLGVGVYDVWVKITDSPEVPVRKVGQLTVT